MRIILLRDVKGMGKRYDIKNVKDGYARNFLIPQGFAKIADDASITELENKKIKWTEEEKKMGENLRVLAKKLEQERFEFAMKAGTKNELFGSVTAGDIKEKIQERLGGTLLECEILLPRALKTIGTHTVAVDFGHGVRGEITVELMPQR